MSDPDQKEIVKQAIKEWMDDRYADLGRYAVKSVLIMAITVILWKYIELRGFKLP